MSAIPARAAHVRDRIRLVAIDIDGTLVDDDLEVRPRTAAAIRDASAAGVVVVLATGRMASSALPYAERLGLRSPIIALQGAVVREMPDAPAHVGRLLLHRPLAADAARDVLGWCALHGIHGHVNHLERMIVPAGDPRTEDYSKFRFGRVVIAADVAAMVRQPVSKVIAVGEAGRPTDLLPSARATFEGRAWATVSHPMFLEFLAPGVSKGRAVRWLARRLGIAPSATMAVGDQLNDLEMVADAGVGVAMADAPEALRSAARVVAPPVAEEGAAQVIEAYVLGRRARAS